MMKDFNFSMMAPLQLDPLDDSFFAEYAQNALRMNVSRVFLSAPGLKGAATPGLEDYRRYAGLLKERIAFFADYGIKTGFWYAPTLGWDVLVSDGVKHPYQQLTGHDGHEETGISCPLDPAFADFFAESFKILAASGVDLIITEDDYRLHLRSVPFGCFCPLHLAAFREETGLDLSRDELVNKVLTGKPNDIRNRWMDFLGKGLVELAAKTRAAVDEVNPAVRLGITAVMSHFSHEGFDVCDLLTAFSGRNRPFMRNIGAPYWSKSPVDTGFIIEYARLQQKWVEKTGAELVGEGDPFPHNRYLTPASYLTAYAQGLAVSGFPGLLAYAQSYSSLPSHDDGYVSRLEKLLPNIEAIRALIPDEYKAVGVAPIEVKNNFKHLTLPDTIDTGLVSWPDKPYSLQMLSRLGIPITFEDETAPVFIAGYAATGLPEETVMALLRRGAVLDGVAAKSLFEQGYDIGVSQMDAAPCVPRFEKYLDPDSCGKYTGDHNWMISKREDFYFCSPKPGAKTITSFMDPALNQLFPGVLHYESPTGYRVAILPFSLQRCVPGTHDQAAFSLQRAYQLTRTFAWVGKKPLPACVPDIPNLHLIARCSPDRKTLAVYLQNTSADLVENPVVMLPAGTDIQSVHILADGADSLQPMNNPVFSEHGIYLGVELDVHIPAMGGIVAIFSSNR